MSKDNQDQHDQEHVLDSNCFKFSDSFWDDNGLNLIQNYFKENIKNMENFVNFLNERHYIEMDLAKRISKLSHKSSYFKENASLNDVFVSIKSELESEATQHVNRMTEFKRLASILSSHIKDIKKNVKNTVEEINKKKKEYESYMSDISRAKSKYCSDNEKVVLVEKRLGNQEVKNDARAVEKLETTKAKIQKSLVSSEKNYQKAVEKAVKFYPKFYEKITASYDNFEKIANRRYEYLNDFIDDYSNTFRTNGKFYVKIETIINEASKSITPAKDIKEWVIKNRTCTDPPNPPIFEIFQREDMNEAVMHDDPEPVPESPSSNASSENRLFKSSSKSTKQAQSNYQQEEEQERDHDEEDDHDHDHEDDHEDDHESSKDDAKEE